MLSWLLKNEKEKKEVVEERGFTYRPPPEHRPPAPRPPVPPKKREQ